jgi:hypothetical protein
MTTIPPTGRSPVTGRGPSFGMTLSKRGERELDKLQLSKSPKDIYEFQLNKLAIDFCDFQRKHGQKEVPVDRLDAMNNLDRKFGDLRDSADLTSEQKNKSQESVFGTAHFPYFAHDHYRELADSMTPDEAKEALEEHCEQHKFPHQLNHALEDTFLSRVKSGLTPKQKEHLREIAEEDSESAMETDISTTSSSDSDLSDTEKSPKRRGSSPQAMLTGWVSDSSSMETDSDSSGTERSPKHPKGFSYHA